MTAARSQIDPQLVYLDPFLFDRARLNAGLSLKKLEAEADVDYRSLRGIGDRKGIFPHSAKSIADALGLSVAELLAPWDPRYQRPAELPGPWSGATEWETEGYLDRGRLASNGLYYLVCRMRHRHSGRQGRGKFYHLSWMTQRVRTERQHQLSRHALVSARVGTHRHVVTTLTCCPAERDQGWWVVDDWVGEQTLADRLATERWPAKALPRLLWEIATGVAALHDADVVFRELAPARILIADKDGRAVLTDFELAKLLDGSPSVSSEWPEDPFRAPEAENGVVNPSADLFSLGQVAAAALTGPEFDPGKASAKVTAAKFPARLESLLRACLEPIPTRRPKTIANLLAELERWSER